MLESVPWTTMTPFQKVSDSLAMEKRRYLTHINRHREQCVQDMLDLPREVPCQSLGEIFHSEAMREAVEAEKKKQECMLSPKCNMAPQPTCEPAKPPPRCPPCDPKYAADAFFPPDSCQLTFGAQTRLPVNEHT